MPHQCAGCGKEFSDARIFKEGCPECGGRKFIFLVSKIEKIKKGSDYEGNSRVNPKKGLQSNSNERQDNTKEKPSYEPIESINILEPGRYDLNLTKLAASDDLVVRLGDGDTYRLDLHSMVRKKKDK